MVKKRAKVAVIGLGAYGIVTVKNLLEVGYDVVGFDQNEYIGGLWKATTNPNRTSVLQSTIANISKQRNCYTDFPFPADVPDHPTGAQMHAYLESFAEHFNLRPNFRLGTTILSIKRLTATENWLVVSQKIDQPVAEEIFEKVVITTGAFQTAILPQIPGMENFTGQVTHSQAFKDPKRFRDKTVLIIGLSNSGADSSVELAKVAKKLYISHRSGARVISRRVNGSPADHLATRSLMRLARFLSSISPALMNKLIASKIEKAMKASYPNLNPAWKLLPAPPPSHSIPIINDHFIDILANGSAESVVGIDRILASGEILLTNGTKLVDIDAIICCTGYRSSFAILDPDADPTNGPTPEYDAAPYGSSVRRYTRLYQGIFSPKYPDSLAFIGPYLIINTLIGADVVSQAIGHIFTGAYPLPSQSVIDKWCDSHYRWSVKQATLGRSPVGLINSAEVEKWLDKVNGDTLEKKLGWGLEGWKFWWQERELYNLILNGVNTGFVYRLFDGKKKRWDGARKAIYEANNKTWKPKDA